MDFLIAVLQESWVWILLIGVAGLLVALLIIRLIKKTLCKVVILVLSFLLAGFGGGIVDTVSEYSKDASSKGLGVVEYVIDYVKK